MSIIEMIGAMAEDARESLKTTEKIEKGSERRCSEAYG